MIERPLLTPDELKSLPKGDFIVMKTGVHPMRVHLKLFFNGALSLTTNTHTPYLTKATVRSSMPTKRKFRTASSKISAGVERGNACTERR